MEVLSAAMQREKDQHRKTRSFANRVLLVILVLGLSGCSTLRLSYGYLDWWLSWKLRDYIELNDTQSDQFAAQVDAFHRWHRTTQLPDYADMLEQMAADVAQGEVDSTWLMRASDRFERLWEASGQQLITGVAPVAGSLSRAQLTELGENLRERNRKDLKDWNGESSKRVKKRAKRMKKNLKRWLGRLTPEQNRIIDNWAANLSSFLQQHIAQRELWQGQLLALLYAPPATFEQDFTRLIVDPEHLWSADYRAHIEARQQQVIEMIAQILATASEKQKAHLIGELQRYADDFRYLAAQGDQPDTVRQSTQAPISMKPSPAT